MNELDKLRAEGLSVAVHNDYRQGGRLFTFWLMTAEIRGQLFAFKGEGETDAIALAQIRKQWEAGVAA